MTRFVVVLRGEDGMEFSETVYARDEFAAEDIAADEWPCACILEIYDPEFFY